MDLHRGTGEVAASAKSSFYRSEKLLNRQLAIEGKNSHNDFDIYSKHNKLYDSNITNVSNGTMEIEYFKFNKFIGLHILISLSQESPRQAVIKSSKNIDYLLTLLLS